jgi:adenylate cyclase
VTGLYQRLGPRYPSVALSIGFRLEHVPLIVGVAFLWLYVSMSPTDFALLVGASIALQETYAAMTRRRLQPHLDTLAAWLGGERAESPEAWRAAASLPFELLRSAWRARYPALVSFAWCVFAVWRLDLPAWTVPPLYLATLVVIVQGNVLNFLLVERAMQPVLDDVARDLSDEADVRAVSLPLSRRLLVLLPALNVITAVAAVGLLEEGQPGLGDLGLAVLVATAAAAITTFPLVLLLASSVVSPIHRLQAATERVAAGDLSARVPVVASDETGSLTRAFNRMVAGLQERERLRDAFGTFVDPSLAERVARDGTDLRGEEIELSVLFLDVRGFTSFAERTPARDVVGRLNDLYGVIVPVILRHGGHANKFIGDGLLAVFGAPQRLDDHADAATVAALEIADLVAREFGGELRVGVGVNTETVVVGTIGGGGRLDFTVIGDVVNTAARVESATRETGDDVLITDETRRRLTDGAHAWEARPPVLLKGKSRAVPLYAPAADAASARPSSDRADDFAQKV